MELPRCTPEEVGIESAQVEACIRAVAHEKTAMHGFMAARHGKVFAECWWAPYGHDLPHSNHSFGKSYTATAIGIAIGEGLIRKDEKMVDIFAEEIAEKGIVLPEGMEKITLEHVLTMTNGMAYHPALSGDWIYNYFTTPIVYEPGTHFTYNTTGACMLGAVVQKRTGKGLKEYLSEKLFSKIGIDPASFEWRKFPNGIDAEPGTFATTEDNLRLAMLYLQKGRWGEEQVVPEDFIRDACTIHISTAHAPEPKDGLCGYGYQLWACSIPGAFRFDGGQGQYAIIWPEKDLVVAIHEGGMIPLGPQTTLDALYTTLFAHLQDAPLPENPEEYEKLRSFCQSRALNPDVPNTCPLPAISGQYHITEGRFDPWIAVAPPGADDFFCLFRTPAKDLPVTGFCLSLDEKECLLSFREGQTLTASWDGSLTRHFVDSPYDPMGYYAATARILENGSLEFLIHWLNGWFESTLVFTPTENGMDITTYKLRLNESDNFLVYHSKAEKE